VFDGAAADARTAGTGDHVDDDASANVNSDSSAEASGQLPVGKDEGRLGRATTHVEPRAEDGSTSVGHRQAHVPEPRHDDLVAPTAVVAGVFAASPPRSPASDTCLGL
jgi:hypothetical protein